MCAAALEMGATNAAANEMSAWAFRVTADKFCIKCMSFAAQVHASCNKRSVATEKRRMSFATEKRY